MNITINYENFMRHTQMLPTIRDVIKFCLSNAIKIDCLKIREITVEKLTAKSTLRFRCLIDG